MKSDYRGKELKSMLLTNKIKKKKKKLVEEKLDSRSPAGTVSLVVMDMTICDLPYDHLVQKQVSNLLWEYTVFTTCLQM
jgi:hypothetical protein